MPGLFSDIKLSLKRGACDLSRISSAAGMPMLFDHAGDLPAGRIRDARIRDRSLYATAEVIQTPRNRDHLTELRPGLRPGLSPGFLINDAVLEEDQDGEYCLVVTSWTPYEISSTPIPRNPAAAILGFDGGQDKEDEEDEDNDNDDNKHSVTDIAATAGALAEKAVAGVLAESREINKALLQTYAASTVTDTTRRRSTDMTNEVTAKHKGTGLAADNVAVLRAALDGSTIAPENLVGGQPGQKAIIKLALETGSTGFVVGQRGAADRLMPRDEVRAADRILSLPNLFALETLDQSVPAWSALPGAFAITEAGTRATTDGTIANMDTKPKRIQSAVDYTMVVGNVAPGLEDALIMALTEAANQKIAAEFIAGAGVDPGAVGLRSLTGVNASTYAVADIGGAQSYWSAEDMLPDAMSADRRAWVISESLYRTTRKTLLEPGNAKRVAQNGLLADDSPVIRSSLYPTGEALYGEFGYATLLFWNEAQLIVDRITLPGTVKLTMFVFWSYGVSRADAFTTLKPV